MGITKKRRKLAKMDQAQVNQMRASALLQETREREGVLLRVLFEISQAENSVSTYSGNVLKQMYGEKILDYLGKEITKADKKSKGLDKIVLTGTEAME